VQSYVPDDAIRSDAPWSVVARRRAVVQPPRVAMPGVVGTMSSRSDSTVKGRKVIKSQRPMRTISLYVGNMEKTTPASLKDYIEKTYESSFKANVQIKAVYPLVKKETYAEAGINSTEASAFRVIVEEIAGTNLLNPLFWPENVFVREWHYNKRPAPYPDDGLPASDERGELDASGVSGNLHRHPQHSQANQTPQLPETNTL
jgi:hypothetical protein